MGSTIAIVGAGNLGQAMAAHLALEGHRVRIYNRTAARIDEIRERGGIQIDGAVQGVPQTGYRTNRLEGIGGVGRWGIRGYFPCRQGLDLLVSVA